MNKFWKYLSVLAVLSMLLGYSPSITAQSTPTDNPDTEAPSKLYLPLMNKGVDIQFKAGTVNIGAAQAAEVNCDFEKPTAASGLCPVPGEYIGLEILVDGHPVNLSLPRQEERPEIYMDEQSTFRVANSEVVYANEVTFDASPATLPEGQFVEGQSGSTVVVTQLPQLAEVNAAQLEPGFAEQLFFHTKLGQWMDKYNTQFPLVFHVPSIVPFWKRGAFDTAKFMGTCGHFHLKL